MNTQPETPLNKHFSESEFGQLITFWTLKGKVSKVRSKGTKGLGANRHQVEQIEVNGKELRVSITYTKMFSDVSYGWVEINYCDVYNKRTHLTELFPGTSGLPILEKL